MIKRSRILRSIPTLLVGVLLAPIALPQFSKIEDLSKHLANKLAKKGTKVLAVADLAGPNDTYCGQGEYLGLLLSQMIAVNKSDLTVAKSSAFPEILNKENIAIKDLASAESLRRLAGRVRLDAIVTGTVERTPESYTVNVTARRISDGTVLANDTISLKHTELLDALDASIPEANGRSTARAGINGVSPPVCVYCPDPMYSNEARERKILAASIVFSVVISEDGRALSFRPVKVAGFGLEDEAYKAIRKWRFKPAKDANGRPVTVEIPIEMTFRLTPR